MRVINKYDGKTVAQVFVRELVTCMALAVLYMAMCVAVFVL